MLSVIVPIHNGEAYNRLFLQSLQAYTVSEYELIVIDNCSSDGSVDLFKSAGAQVIRNQGNLCYACSMNQGMEASKGEYLCFANNDILFGRAWDVPVVKALAAGEWVVCPAGIEAAEDERVKKALRRRWGWSCLPMRILGPDLTPLNWSLKLMYGDWDAFCEKRSAALAERLVPGIQGNCVIGRRELFEKLGGWDVRTRSADWHLYLTVSKRAEEEGDVSKPRIAPDSYVHHFIRGTLRGGYPPFSCGHIKTGLEGLWTEAEIIKYGWANEK